jgi:hypothetical protein
MYYLGLSLTKDQLPSMQMLPIATLFLVKYETAGASTEIKYVRRR